MQKGATYRLIAFVAGFFLCAFASFALCHLLPIITFAPLCATVAAVVLLLGFCCFVVSRRNRSLGDAAMICAGSLLLFGFFLAPFVPAARCAWMPCNINSVQTMLHDASENAGVHRDPYDGRYHKIPVAANKWIVYSDGPDHKDDGGKKQIANKVMRFERAFSQIYLPPLSIVRRSIRSCALAEAARIWHSFDGDIVWEVSMSTDGAWNVSLCQTEKQASQQPGPSGRGTAAKP
jgi:hypothetical protein